jgi:hypothetical protein
MQNGIVMSRRQVLQGAALITAGCAKRSSAQQPVVVSVRDFGAVSGRDNTRTIQRAIDSVAARGGGIVEVPGSYECGVIILTGDNIVVSGANGWLINGRIVIPEGRQGCRIENLGIVNRRADASSFALDVSGRNCSFANLTLVKDPVAGGYQMYLRQPSTNCTFTGLKLKGSNGVMVSGRDHSFDSFEFESTMTKGVGGDDAFAIKAVGRGTEDIAIRNGTVRGYYAIVSFGSEIGTEGRPSNHEGFVRNVTVSDVVADRCSSLAFFKPGALVYDWRNGVVEDVRLERLRLVDERGEYFTTGLRMIAGRGAIIRNVVGRQLDVRARAKNQGVQPTSAIDLSILDAEAQFYHIDLQMTFTDPYYAAEHSAAAPGYPVDHIVRIEKTNPRRGQMSDINLDIVGRGARIGGVYIGQGLDGAVMLRRAHLARVALHSPTTLGAGGIWSDSRVTLGDISVDSPVLPRFGGRALAAGRN